MSERLHHIEKHPESKLSVHEDKERQQERLKELLEKAEKTPSHKEHVPHLEKAAKHEAISGKERPVGDIGKEKHGNNTPLIDRTVKKAAYTRELHRIQRKLPKSERTFSKVIHNPTVETISNVGAKTIARPSGVLGGSIAALVGGGLVVWMSHYYGFRYNFFVFIAFLVAGFALGLITELVSKPFLRNRRKA